MFGGLCRLQLTPKKIIHLRISRCMSSSVEGKNANPKNNLASHNIVLYSQVYKFTDCIRWMYCICCWEWNTLRFFPTWFTIAFYHFIPFIFPTISSHLISSLQLSLHLTVLFCSTATVCIFLITLLCCFLFLVIIISHIFLVNQCLSAVWFFSPLPSL